MKTILSLVLALGIAAAQQTAQPVDASASPMTKPVRSVASLPGSCSNNEMLILTAGLKGTYACIDGAWVQQSSTAALPGGSGVVKVASGVGGVVTGTPTDCVKVDGSSGACGSGGVSAVDFPDGAASATIAAGTLHLNAGPSVAMVDGNNTFTGDNKYSELCLATSTGTTAARWVQKTAAGCQVISATTQPVFGLAAATVASASATVYRAGRALCSYSNTAIAGNWATISSSGQCTDSGTAATSAPPSGSVAVAEAAGIGSILVSIWPSPSAVNTGTSSPSINPSYVQEFDEFLPTSFLGGIGKLGWTIVGSAAQSVVSATLVNPGYLTISANGVNGSSGVNLAGYAFSNPWFYAGHSGWEVQFSVHSDLYYTTNTIWRVGLVDGSGQTPTNGIYAELSSSAACTAALTDTAWTFVARASSTSTRTATAVSAATDTAYRIRIRSVSAGTVLFSISTGGGAFTAETSIATNVPTAALAPTFEVHSCDSSNHIMYADRFDYLLTGIAR